MQLAMGRYDFTQVLKMAAFLSVLFLLGALSILAPWYYLAISGFSLLLIVLTLIKFNTGLYLSLLLVPVSSASIGIYIDQLWNVRVDGNWIDGIPLYTPFVLTVAVSLFISKITGIRKEIWIALPPAFYISLGYGFILLMLAPYLMHSLFQLSILIMNLILFLAITNAIENEDSHRRIISIFLVIGFFVAFISISLNFFSEAITYRYEIAKKIFLNIDVLAGSRSVTGEVRRASSLTSTHETGLIMNMMIAVSFGLYLYEKEKWRKFFFLALSFGFLSIALLTMSRAVLIALVAMGFFTVIVTESLRKRFFLNIAIFLSAVFLMLILESVVLNYIFKSQSFEDIRLIKAISDSLKSDSETGKSITDAPGRVKIWGAGFRHLINKFFIGLGPGNFKYFVRAPHAHSVYFSFLFDFGLLGFAILFYIIFSCVPTVLRVLRKQDTYFQIMSTALISGLIAVCVHALVDFEYNTASIWVYIGLVVATINMTLKESNGSELNIAA